MSYYKICPHCGTHLDPGERCDQGAANALDGKVEHANHAVSTSIMNETEVKVK